MECPEDCPEDVYKLMRKCWDWDPNLRPTFKQIYNELENMFPNSISNDDALNKKQQQNTNYYNPNEATTNVNTIRNGNNSVKMIIADQQQVNKQPVLLSFTSTTKLQNKVVQPPKPPERSCSFKDNEALINQCLNNSHQLQQQQQQIKNDNVELEKLNNHLTKSSNKKLNSLLKQKEIVIQMVNQQQDIFPTAIISNENNNNQTVNQQPQLVNTNEFQRVFSNLKKVNKTVENVEENSNSTNGNCDIERKISIKKVFPKTQFTATNPNSSSKEKYESNANITKGTDFVELINNNAFIENDNISELKRNGGDRQSTRSFGKIYLQFFYFTKKTSTLDC